VNRLSITRADAGLLLLAAALVMLYVATSGGGFPLDDSWIHQTYARNLATTGVWAFVPGVPSAASTSPLYTVLLAAGYALGLPYALWTHGLGALALGLTGIVGLRLARQLAPNNRRLPLIVGLALVLNWHLIWAAAAGMETALFSLWTLVIPWLVVRAPSPLRPRDGAVFGVVAALATLTRPEGLLLAGLGGLSLLVANRRPFPRVVAFGLAAAAGCALVITPYAIYNLSLTGGLLPDTADAKQTEYAVLLTLPYIERVGRMVLPLLAGVLPLLVPGLVYYGYVAIKRPVVSGHANRQRSWVGARNALPLQGHDVAKAGSSTGEMRRGRNGEGLIALLPLVWALALIALYAARLPANYQHGRYVIPALPGLIVTGVVGTAWLVQASRRSLPGRVLTQTLAIAAVVVTLLAAFLIGPTTYRQDVGLIDEAMVAAAHWLAANVPPDELLAVHDIGAVGYFAPRPLLDLAGLVSPEVVERMGDPDALWALIEARDARYLMAFPDQIPGGNPSDPRLCRVFSTEGLIARTVGGPDMSIYRLTWDGECSVDV
jgi:hypothetical protein